MPLHRLATPLIAAFTLFSACDLPLPDPNEPKVDTERTVGESSSTTEPELAESTGDDTTGGGESSEAGTTESAPPDLGSDSTSGSTGDEDSTSTGADESSTGDAESTESGEESSSTGAPPEPIETCEQLDPAACSGTGMCVFDADIDAATCVGEDLLTPGVVLYPQDAMQRHLLAGTRELNVISIPDAGTFGVSVVPQGLEYDTGIELYLADGTQEGFSAKTGQDELEFQVAGPSVLFLVVVGAAEIEGDYFVTVSLK